MVVTTDRGLPATSGCEDRAPTQDAVRKTIIAALASAITGLAQRLKRISGFKYLAVLGTMPTVVSPGRLIEIKYQSFLKKETGHLSRRGWMGFETFLASAVNLQPMSAQLEIVVGGYGFEQIFDVATQEILGSATFHA